MPILQNVLLQASKDSVFLTTTNLDLGINCCVKAEVEKEGTVTLPVRELSKIVRELADIEVDVETSDGTKVSISTRGSTFNLVGMDSKEYPPLPGLEESDSFTINRECLLEMLKSVSYAQSVNEERYMLKGVFFKKESTDLSLVATDGRRLAVATKEITISENDGNCEFIMYGPGVEKIFDEVKEIFPLYKASIFSSDYLKTKERTNNLFKAINENKIDILVGTQMISKGFNFPKLNCIVVIDADFSGRGYDLRTTEKNIQLYHQLSGRAGRFSSKSLIIYQTLTPQDFTLNELIKNKSEDLLKNELILREKNNLPPFIRLIAIIISSKDRSLSLQGAREIKLKLNQINNLEVLGPVDSPLLKIKKNFRSRLLIRFNNQSMLQKKITNVLNGLKISPKIKLTVDVDPINFA